MGITSYTGKLHTASSYALQNIDFDFSQESHSKSNIDNLKIKEQWLYSQFGETTYEGFITQLRQLFDGEDAEVIRRFEANSLQKSLQIFTMANQEIFNQDVQFVFDFDKIPNLTEDLQKWFKTKKGISISGTFDPVYLNFNPTDIKKVLNDYFGTHHFRSKNWTKNLDKFISDLTGAQVLTISTKQSDGTYIEHKNISTIPNFPWGVLKRDVELAEQLGEESFLYQELIRATKRIKDYIFNTLGKGVSSELQSAMHKVWDSNFSAKENNPVLFFSGGTKSNFISGVQGALGEFQTAVIFEYLAIKKVTNAFASIIGNSYKNKEQLRTDVAVFDKLGLQVKNVSQIWSDNKATLLRDLTTTIHPQDFASYLDNQESFLDFLANYYFNISYQGQVQDQFELLHLQLGEYLGEIMNMAMSDQLSDVVTFYMIGGKYLVPCSAILESAEQLNLKESIKITSSYTGKTDFGYRGEYTESKNGKKQPSFVKFWHWRRSGWYSTEKNQSEYDYLISKGISIRTNFNLLENIEKFSIF